MTVERGKQDVGLGLREPRDALLPLHEARELPGIPRPLGLVKHHDVVGRRRGAAEGVAPEVMNVLNEGLHFIAAGAFANR